MKAGIIGAGRRGIGSALLAALATGAAWMKGPVRFDAPLNPFGGSKPTDARHWHDIYDPVQQKSIFAAQAKRSRRAKLLSLTASALPNRAHLLSYNPHALNPFYIAK